MSKCKAVLDGDKITTIQVKTKAPAGDQPKTESKPQGSDDKSKQAPATASQK